MPVHYLAGVVRSPKSQRWEAHYCLWVSHTSNVSQTSAHDFYSWAQNAFQTVSFGVPDNWVSGRIWARRNCDFSSNPGPNSCMPLHYTFSVMVLNLIFRP